METMEEKEVLTTQSSSAVENGLDEEIHEPSPPETVENQPNEPNQEDLEDELNDEYIGTTTDEENSKIPNSNESEEVIGVRNRKENKETLEDNDTDQNLTDEEEKKIDGKLIGVTPSGKAFLLPKTKNPLTLYPISQWDFFDWLKDLAGLNLILVFLPLPSWFYISWFIFWRLAYNVGLGYLLHIQSKDRAITKIFEPWTEPSHPFNPLLKFVVSSGMGPDFKFEDMPAEFNAWMGFRRLVDVILANDLMSYYAFCFAHWEWPESITITVVLSYIVGAFLCAFTVWAKTDAYRVVKDFAWYWGDFFFLVNQKLTFDRVFSISPHPMYTIGYTFFYGAALLTQSYTVLYVSLIGHFCQLAFLSFVENPHIEKTYPGMVEDHDPETRNILYDLKTGYFRRDLIVFKNLNPFRSADLFVIVIILYVVMLNLLNLNEYFYISQAIVWRLFHSFGLGYILHIQSNNQFYTDLFLKKGFTKQYAFENWKAIFNLSLAVTHVVFISCAFKYTTFSLSMITDGLKLLKITIGLLLIALNIWSSVSTFEVLGEIGWFYGDFFINEVSTKLYYSGIYRFINNPESVTGFAGYYGLALISDSWQIFAIALFSQAANALFVRYVEEPHMRKLYGDRVREKSGIELAISEIVHEAVESSPQLKKLKNSKIVQKANELNRRAKIESQKLVANVSQRAQILKEKATERARAAAKLRDRRATDFSKSNSPSATTQS